VIDANELQGIGNRTMNKTTYAVNTKSSEFTTTNSLAAARVFVSLLKDGREPSARAMVDLGWGVSVREVTDWSFRVCKMQKIIAAAAK